MLTLIYLSLGIAVLVAGYKYEDWRREYPEIIW